MEHKKQLKSTFIRTNTLEEPQKQVVSSFAESLLVHKSFYFQQRRGDLDLRGISRVDVDKVVKEVDIDTLQSFLENITFSDVSSEDLKLYSDDSFIRLFQITQLTLEYLLNVQDTLASNLDNLAQKYSKKKRELERTKSSVVSKDEEIARLKRENKRKRKTIGAYETMLRQVPPAVAGAASSAAPAEFVKDATGAEQKSANDNKPIGPEEEVHLYIIRWFIGTCLDLTVTGRTTVMEIKAQVCKLTNSTMSLVDQMISLKGVQLKDGDRVMDTCIRDESVLVLMDDRGSQQHLLNQFTMKDGPTGNATEARLVTSNQPSAKTAAAAAAVAVAVAAEQNDLIASRALQSQEELSKATALLQNEIARGVEREKLMREEMEKRVNKLEETIRREVKQEMSLQMNDTSSTSVGNSSAYENRKNGGVAIASNAGDLESDDEGETVLTRTEIARRMNDAETQMKKMEDDMRISIEIMEFEKLEKTKMGEELLEVKKREQDAILREEGMKEELLKRPTSSKSMELDEDDGPLEFADESDEDTIQEKSLKQEVGEKGVGEEGDKEVEETTALGEGEDKEDEGGEGKIQQEETLAMKKFDKNVAGDGDENSEEDNLNTSWILHLKDENIDIDVDDSTDMEAIRITLASKLEKEASTIRFMEVTEGEGEQSITKVSQLRTSYEGERLKLVVEDEVISMSLVAKQLEGANEAISKFADSLSKKEGATGNSDLGKSLGDMDKIVSGLAGPVKEQEVKEKEEKDRMQARALEKEKEKEKEMEKEKGETMGLSDADVNAGVVDDTIAEDEIENEEGGIEKKEKKLGCGCKVS